MRINEYIINRLKRKAAKTNCVFKISALGFNYKGELVAQSSNQKRYLKYGGGKHAEDGCFRLAKRKGIKTILICRVSRTGNLLPIDPCSRCKEIADNLGIKIISVKE